MFFSLLTAALTQAASPAARAAVAVDDRNNVTVRYAIDEATEGLARAECDADNPIHDQASCNGKPQRVAQAAKVLAAVRASFDDTAALQAVVAAHGAKALRLDRMIYDQLQTGGGAGGDGVLLREQLTANMNEQAGLLSRAQDLQDQLARLNAVLAAHTDPAAEQQRGITARALGEATAALTAKQAAAAELVGKLAALGDQSIVFRGLVTQRHAEADTVRATQARLAGTIATLADLGVFFQLVLDRHDTFDILTSDRAFPELKSFPPQLEVAFAAAVVAERDARRAELTAQIAALQQELKGWQADPDELWVADLRYAVENPVYSGVQVLAKLRDSSSTYPTCQKAFQTYNYLREYWGGLPASTPAGAWAEHVDEAAAAIDRQLDGITGWRYWVAAVECERDLWRPDLTKRIFEDAVQAMEAAARATLPLCDYALPPHTEHVDYDDIRRNDCVGLPLFAVNVKRYQAKGGRAWLVEHNAAWMHAGERRAALTAQIAELRKALDGLGRGR